MVFDILEKNGKSLLDRPYLQRIQQLPEFPPGICELARSKLFTLPEDQDSLRVFFETLVKEGY